MSETTTAVSPEMAALMAEPNISEMPWVDPPTLPPSDLPYDDGEPMESPWHVGSGPLLKAGYIAARGGQMLDFYVGVNMFVYYSWKQVRNQDYKGPDVYFVQDVDGQKPRLYWAIWDEDGRYPDVIVELLSPSTEDIDLTAKLALYEQTFRIKEYFCVAPECERMLGWSGRDGRLRPIEIGADGRIWSEQLGLWFGPWRGVYQGEEHTWPRFYHADGSLVLLKDESEQQRADAEQQRADAEQQRADAEQQRANQLAARVAALEAELARLRAET
jgi:Uma2 family endonuclease